MAVSPTFHRALSFVVLALAAIVCVNGTQVMRRPDNYKEPPRTLRMATNVNTTVVHKRAEGKVSFAYFTNWGIYGANFQPTDIVTNTLTHILYAFADTSAETGNLRLTDSYADQEKHFPGDSWDEPGNNLYGCLKQLYLLKLANRNLKVLLSVGGWTYSQAGHFGFVTSASSRATFVRDAVRVLEDYGFDGIDLDFEYPSNAAQGQGFANLFTELRQALDNLASSKGESNPYLLSAAVSAGAENYRHLVIPQMNAAMDFWNLMAYDYAGSWLTYADHQANLYGGVRTGVSTDAAVRYFTANGADADKITMGIPLYGRAFQNTDGIGQPYSGIGPGTIEPGIYSYKTLPLAGAQVIENTTDVTSYSYSSNRELVSYDTPNIVRAKAEYINQKGLAGSMFWELSTDKVGAESLVGTSASVLGALDTTQNHINYPNSRWTNIVNNMGRGGGGSPTEPTDPSEPTNPPAGCNGVAAWNPTTIYTGGNQASYNGRLWTAKWWTQGENPEASGEWGVWRDEGPC